MAAAATDGRSRTVRLHSEDGSHTTQAVFFAPPADAEACPITTEPLGSNCLEGCETLAVFEDDATLAAVRLECAHCFNAMALLYHWMGSSMRCPICRRGADARLAAEGLAGAWIAWCRARVLDRLKGDALRALHDDERMVRQFMEEMRMHAETLSDFEVLIELTASGDVGAVVLEPSHAVVAVATLAYLYVTDRNGLPRAMHCANLVLRQDGDEQRFVARHSCVRALNRAIRDVAPQLLSFCTVAHRLSGESEVLAQTPPVAIDELAGTLSLPDTARGARYTVECSDGAIRALACELAGWDE
jgi:hypothetical protein